VQGLYKGREVGASVCGRVDKDWKRVAQGWLGKVKLGSVGPVNSG